MAAKIARDPSEGNDDRLPPPPQPPSSPPPPIWAGGECECSCPCMGSSSDEWDNDFSPVDETPLNLDAGREEHYATRNASEETASDARQVEGRRREEEGSSVRSVSSEEEEEVKGETSSQHDYVSGSEENSSTIDWTTSNYESESSGVSSVSGCSGTTPLPPEPTILILEGEAPFTIVFFKRLPLFFLTDSLTASLAIRCINPCNLFSIAAFLSLFFQRFFFITIPISLCCADASFSISLYLSLALSLSSLE